jgi:hypothetical protein
MLKNKVESYEKIVCVPTTFVKKSFVNCIINLKIIFFVQKIIKINKFILSKFINIPYVFLGRIRDYCDVFILINTVQAKTPE